MQQPDRKYTLRFNSSFRQYTSKRDTLATAFHMIIELHRMSSLITSEHAVFSVNVRCKIKFIPHQQSLSFITHLSLRHLWRLPVMSLYSDTFPSLFVALVVQRRHTVEIEYHGSTHFFTLVIQLIC